MNGIAPITSGSLFTGKFEFDFMEALQNPLSLIKFGVSYENKPLYFKGYILIYLVRITLTVLIKTI